MTRRELVKVIFQDQGDSKFIKGYIESEDEHLVKIRTEADNKIITVGKRAIIQISPLPDKPRN